jgi:hypothetical protein
MEDFVTVNGAEALARLDVLVGEWSVEAQFPALANGKAVMARSRFQWALNRQFLLQCTEVPLPEAPDSLSIISVDQTSGEYTQHYYDSRGVMRLYAMSLADGVWTLTRESADFTPLNFRQRFVGRFGADGNTISGAWEHRPETARTPDGLFSFSAVHTAAVGHYHGSKAVAGWWSRCAILSTTTVASSPTPINSDDLRFRKKCTPQK